MSFYFLIFWFFPCRYNQVDKHLKDKALQCIISRKLKGNYLLHYDMKLLRRKKMPLIKQRFFFLLFFLDFRVFVFFPWLQEFHESLIDLLLGLKGCVVDNTFSHAGIGGEFFHF